MLYTYDVRTTIKKYSLVLLILIALGYAAFQAYPLLMGPTITIYYPHDGDIVSTSTFEISGRALRSKEITVQGRTISTDTDGTFRETLVAYPPYTIVVVTALDSYGKRVTKELKVLPK